MAVPLDSTVCEAAESETSGIFAAPFGAASAGAAGTLWETAAIVVDSGARTGCNDLASVELVFTPAGISPACRLEGMAGKGVADAG